MRQGTLLVWFRVRNALADLCPGSGRLTVRAGVVRCECGAAASGSGGGTRPADRCHPGADPEKSATARVAAISAAGCKLAPGFGPERITPGTWLLRLDCSSRRDCLPFHAVLSTAAAGLASQADEWTSAVQALAPGSRRQPGPSAVLLAHSGERVSLVEELAGMRLQVKVVCLQSGGLGDRIRVQNPTTHRVLLATVAGKELVRVE